MAMQIVEIIAHRGASYDAPENTLAALRLGWQQADLVEIDIHQTSDGEIVLIHDDNTKRTAGLDKRVADQTLAEIRQLDAGIWKDARFTGEKNPTLDEAIEAMPDGKRLVIEVKCGAEVIPALQRSLERSGKSEQQFVIIAFSHTTLKAIKVALPEITMYWLQGFKENQQPGQITPTVDTLIQQAKDAHVEGVNLAYTGPIDAAFVRQIHAAGLKCYVWTVDSPDEARRLIAAGVDGITTNRPAWLCQQIDSATAPVQPR